MLVPLYVRLFIDIVFGVFVDYILSVDVVLFESHENKILFWT